MVPLRFVLGVAIGADYPIATSLLAEFLPRRHRGRMLGAVFVVWAVGAAAAYPVGFLLRGMGPDAWRWMLASPAMFAVITLLLRLGTPESPRWLLSSGRIEDARAAIKKVYGTNTTGRPRRSGGAKATTLADVSVHRTGATPSLSYPGPPKSSPYSRSTPSPRGCSPPSA